MTDLTVGFAGSEVCLSDSDRFTFGRDADLSVDTNPYLHRRLGLISHRSGVWWLENVGDRIPIEIRDAVSLSRFVLAPGATAAITFPASLVRFAADGRSYELELGLAEIEGAASVASLGNEADDTSRTISLASLPLTDDQRRVLVVLCEVQLRDPAADLEIPTNRIAAKRLGWTVKAYGRKLDNVCDRLSRIGVRGLRGDSASLAKDRRAVLARYALSSSLVTPDDLELLR